MSSGEFWRPQPANRLQMLVPDQIFAWRDKLLASPKFQRWAATFPLTRQIAQRQARAAFDLCAGFVYSQVLYTCVELKVIDALAAKPMTLDELAQHTGLEPEAMARLVKAAASLGLVSNRSGGRYGLGMQGAAIAGNPSIALMVQHHAMLYRDLEDPIALLRGKPTSKSLAQYWPYATADRPSSLAPDAIEGYSRLMSASQALIARDIIDAYDFGRHEVLLDIGGGEGTFLKAVAARIPIERYKGALMLHHLLEPAAFLRDVLVFPRLGRLGDAVDIALVDADELDALCLELLERIGIQHVDVHP